MKQRAPLLALALALAVLIALAITGAVNEIVVAPLLYLLWVANVVYQIIPQALLWGLWLLLAAALIGRSLFRPAPLVAQPQAPAAAAPGRVARWVRFVRRANGDQYERWSLAQQLAVLATEVLAHEGQCTPQEIQKRIESGALPLPPDVRAYLLAGLAPYVATETPARSFWQVVFGGRGQSAAPAGYERDPQPTLQYLENTLHQAMGEAQ